jgi:hypothetical protein
MGGKKVGALARKVLAHTKTPNNIRATFNTKIIQLNNMSSLINTTGQSNESFQEEVYDSWRRQMKYFEMETKKLKKEVRQMQEKLDSLQQKQLLGDLGRGRNTMNRSKFNKFDHINMEIVLGLCKNRMFSIYKFLEASILIFSSTPIDNEFYWSNNRVPMINKKYIEKSSNFNTEVKRVYTCEFKDVTYQSSYLYCV